MNPGIIIGTVAILIGLAALGGALVLRMSSRANPSLLLRYLFLGGIPILFLCSAAGFWDCYASGDWTKCLIPVAMLLFAANALINRRTCIDLLDKLTDNKHAVSNSESSSKVHDGH